MNKIQVVYVIDPYRVALNVGAADNVSRGDKYLLYTLSDEEIIDPSSHKSLGYLEIVKGVGIVENVQDKMCTLKSCEFSSKTKKIIHGNTTFFPVPRAQESEVVQEREPFDNPEEGDYAKPV